MSAPFAVRLSKVDWESHAFPAAQMGETESRAACGHAAAKEEIITAGELSPTCDPCALAFGAAEADRMDSTPNASRWDM